MFRKTLVALAAAATLAVAACTPAETGTLVAINGALAKVSCPTVASSSNTIADNVITIAAPNASAAAQDAQLAAASANLLAEACPALVGVSGLVVQATVDASLANQPTAGVPSVTTAKLRSLEAKYAMKHGLKASAPKCALISLEPYKIQCDVTVAK